MKFNDFGFTEQLQDGLDAMGFENATPIQQQAIPLILDGQDLIACAQTGTGKTAAFLLPILNKLVGIENRALNTLIIAPTRELVVQIDQQIQGLAYFVGVSSIAVYGGGDGDAFVQQRRALSEGAEIIVATPGRLIALLNSGQVNFKHLQHLILDEADRMLDMGFYQDIMRIVGYLPKDRQTLLFSATMPPKIRQLAGQILTEPEQLNIAISKPAEGITQLAYSVYDTQKLPLLQDILSNDSHKSIVIFASTKEKVREIDKELQRKKLNIKGFQSDLEQAEREQIMLAFKNKQLRILVATDIISRGIDVDGIDLVINYDVPPDPEDYIHRIGRTARAETTGTAITFISPRDQRRFQRIEKLMEREVEKLPVPEALGEAPAYDPNTKPRVDDRRKPGGGSGGGKFRKKPAHKPGDKPHRPAAASPVGGEGGEAPKKKKKKRFFKKKTDGGGSTPASS